MRRAPAIRAVAHKRARKQQRRQRTHTARLQLFQVDLCEASLPAVTHAHETSDQRRQTQARAYRFKHGQQKHFSSDSLGTSGAIVQKTRRTTDFCGLTHLRALKPSFSSSPSHLETTPPQKSSRVCSRFRPQPSFLHFCYNNRTFTSTAWTARSTHRISSTSSFPMAETAGCST